MEIDVDNMLEQYDAVVFDKDNCGKCVQTEDLMRDLGVNFTTVNMSHNKDALKKVKSDGHRSAPAVYVKSGNWSGHQEEEIVKFASSLGLSSVKDTADSDEDDDTWDY